MPYGTVNLRHGVPKGETTVTCTAGVGTFLLEFGALSRLTGDPIFEKTAVRAIRALWKFRSPLGLVSDLVIFSRLLKLYIYSSFNNQPLMNQSFKSIMNIHLLVFFNKMKGIFTIEEGNFVNEDDTC